MKREILLTFVLIGSIFVIGSVYSSCSSNSYKISGYVLDFKTGLPIQDGSVTAVIEESGENSTSNITNGYYELVLCTSKDYNKNMFTIGMVASSEDKMTYYSINVGAGNSLAHTQSCSIKKWHFKGSAIDSESGNPLQQGSISVSVDGISDSNTTNFSNGTWEIYFSPCLITGRVYIFKFILANGDKTSYSFLDQVAK